MKCSVDMFTRGLLCINPALSVVFREPVFISTFHSILFSKQHNLDETNSTKFKESELD